ncbi:MAG: replicative DNA helicase, partial [Prevotella sp.]|nr:replicative DNA helicase [Prevotella sp.]
MPPISNSRKRSATQAIDTTLGHIPPQAVDIEKVVLGALMIDTDAFSVVSEILHPETFYEPRHQKIYHAIQSLNMREKPVDIMTVCEELKHEGTYDEVGAPTYIVDLTQTVASSANISYHSHILAQKYLARQLITYASNVETKALDEAQDVDELMQEAEGALFTISQKNMRQDYTQIDPVVVQARELILKAANSNTGGITGVPSGYTEFDKVTSGWQPSDLVIIAGRPAMGKTSFALSLAKNIAVDNHDPVAFFSLEMNNVQLVNRLISNVCSVPGSKIMNGQLSQDEWSRFDNNIGRLMGAPLYVDDTPGLSVFELRTKARRLVREKGVKVIMIDYLQLMNANGMKFNSRQEEVSTISRSLKGLAKELDIPIIALSQLSRAVEQRPGEDGKRPQLSDLRESGAIEQDADMVLFVHRP